MSASTYITTDNMLQQCKGVVDYEGEIPAGSVIRFKKGDILLSNIRPYLKKTWFADRDGGCSPDVLVFRVKDESKVNGGFIAKIMQRDQFFDYVMQDVKGIKMPRGKKEHILSYSVAIPEMSIQNDIMEQVQDIESKIAELQNSLERIADKKTAIIRKYLNDETVTIYEPKRVIYANELTNDEGRAELNVAEETTELK